MPITKRTGLFLSFSFSLFLSSCKQEDHSNQKAENPEGGQGKKPMIWLLTRRQLGDGGQNSNFITNLKKFKSLLCYARMARDGMIRKIPFLTFAADF